MVELQVVGGEPVRRRRSPLVGDGRLQAEPVFDGTVFIRDGNERDPVDEPRAVGVVVAYLDRDGTPPVERLAELSDGRGVGPRALEPTQVVAL